MAAIHLLPPPTSDRPEAVVFALWVPTTPKPDGNRHGRLAQAGEPLAPDRAQGWGRGMGGRPPPLGQLGTAWDSWDRVGSDARRGCPPSCRTYPRATDLPWRTPSQRPERNLPLASIAELLLFALPPVSLPQVLERVHCAVDAHAYRIGPLHRAVLRAGHTGRSVPRDPASDPAAPGVP